MHGQTERLTERPSSRHYAFTQSKMAEV